MGDKETATLPCGVPRSYSSEEVTELGLHPKDESPPHSAEEADTGRRKMEGLGGTTVAKPKRKQSPGSEGTETLHSPGSESLCWM